MISILDEFLMNLSTDAIPSYTNYKGEIFHYTSLRNIQSILLDSQDKIILWASQYDCLNDISEGTVVEPCYYKTCEKLKANGSISETLYNILTSIKISRNETFITIENDTVRPYRGEYTTYITSFSKSNDLLPMWNYYSKGDLFEGINLGINSELILSSFPNFFADGKMRIYVSPVIYSSAEQELLMEKFILEIARNYRKEYESSIRSIASMKLTSLKMIFKQECFRHEQEVRIIVDVANKYKDICPVRYRTNAGYIIPYIEIPVNKSALKSVTLGPFRGTETQLDLQKKTLSEMLVSNQYKAKINISKVPVRY